MQTIQKILTERNIRSHRNEGILICNVASADEGFALAKDMLFAMVDKTTVLYLSGGRTPKDLYESLSTDGRLHPGGVALVDERYGPPMHNNSNEKMLKDTGLLRYFQYRDIPFYPILQLTPRHPEQREGSEKILHSVQNDNNREATAQLYDDKLRSLLSIFKKHIAILGVGLDGHTAGLPAQSSKLKIQNSKLYEDYRLVTEYNDSSGVYGERVTMTFLGLSMMDLLIVLVFGEDKQKALGLMFSSGSEEDIPSRFFKRPEIAAKTLFITDQMV